MIITKCMNNYRGKYPCTKCRQFKEREMLFVKKRIMIIVLAILLASAVAVSVAAATNDFNSAAVESSDTENSNVIADKDTVADKTMPADISDGRDGEEIPVKVLNAVTKSDYFNKILNSVDYYNLVNGTIETNMLNGTDFSIEYNVNMSDCRAYQHIKGAEFDEEVFVQDGKIYTVDNTNDNTNYNVEPAYAKSYEAAADESGELNTSLSGTDAEDRVTYTTNGEMNSDATMVPVYHYRLNPTNVHYASTISLFPQEMAFGFLSNENLWKISEKTQYLGRDCTILEGTTDKNYGAKLSVNRFVMIVDDESGIILKFEGYDSNDNLTQYSTTTSVSFVEEEIKTFVS